MFDLVANGELKATPGQGQFIARDPIDLTGYPGTKVPELDDTINYGAGIAP